MRTGTTTVVAGGLGVPLAGIVLAGCEAGLPLPIPADFVMLLLGERAAAGTVPLWGAVLIAELAVVAGVAVLLFAVRGPARGVLSRLGPRVGLTQERIDRTAAAVERRGTLGLVSGRATPGLRTLTVLAAAVAGIRPRRALPPLVLGGTVFVQVHVIAGYVLGPSAVALLRKATLPALLVLSALLAGGFALWLWRRRRGGAAAQGWAEACCPACLAVSAVRRRQPLSVKGPVNGPVKGE